MPDRLPILVAGLVLFSFAHSALAGEGVKARLTRRLGGRPQRYRLLYNLTALALLVLVLVSTRGDYPVVWRAHGLARAALLAVQGIAFAGFLLTVRSFDPREFSGLGRLPHHGAAERLQTGGMYALCRHPLYFFTSLFFSAWPAMDSRSLVIAVWLWAYSALGSIPEERKLLRAFGPAYRRYQSTHPRLLPLGRRRRPGGP